MKDKLIMAVTAFMILVSPAALHMAVELLAAPQGAAKDPFAQVESWDLGTNGSRKAFSDYQIAVQKARQWFHGKQQDAEKALLATLSREHEKLSQDGKLAEAARLVTFVEMFNEAQGLPINVRPNMSTDRLSKSLEGSTWKWINNKWLTRDGESKNWVVTLQAGHTIQAGFHQAGGMWAAISDRDVIIMMRSEDRKLQKLRVSPDGKFLMVYLYGFRKHIPAWAYHGG